MGNVNGEYKEIRVLSCINHINHEKLLKKLIIEADFFLKLKSK